MRDEQVQRYARHIQLPDIGGLGQTSVLVSSARIALRDADPRAELLAATFLAAGGVGTLVVPNASDAQRSELAAHGPDTRVVADGTGRDVALEPRPSWWPTAEGDAEALAYWRGGLAAAIWLADAASR
jgi:hypothetical protein